MTHQPPIVRLDAITALERTPYPVDPEEHGYITYGDIDVDDIAVLSLVYDHPENLVEIADLFNSIVEANSTWQVLIDFASEAVQFLIHTHSEELEHINMVLSTGGDFLTRLTGRLSTNMKLVVRAVVRDDRGDHQIMATQIRPDLISFNWTMAAALRHDLHLKRN